MNPRSPVDLDLWRAALLLISRYGKQAAMGRVRLRAANLKESGADSEATNWLQIADTIDQIEGD